MKRTCSHGPCVSGRADTGRYVRALMAFHCLVVMPLLAAAQGTGKVRGPLPPDPIYPRSALLKRGMCIAFAGDSITAQKHWPSFIETYLRVCRPDLELRFVQHGLSGERAPEYATRIGVELLPFRPDLVLTLYGMNDSGFRPYTAATGAAYGAGLDSIITQLADAGVAVVVGGPPPADTYYYAVTNLKHKRRRFGMQDGEAIEAAFNENLAALRGIARSRAEAHGVAFADVYAFAYNAMLRAKAELGADQPVCGSDGIHPGPNGALAFAYAFLRVLGEQGELGTITYDFATGQATATGGHTVLAIDPDARRISLESSTYPFCFTVRETDVGEPKDPQQARTLLPFLPFNEDLNRLILKVTNPPAARIRVTWGEWQHSFTAAELTAGINLAAAFIPNPFNAAFAEVESLVIDRQQLETNLRHHLCPKFNQEQLAKTVPELIDDLKGRQQALDARIAAARRPVRHALTVEAE